MSAAREPRQGHGHLPVALDLGLRRCRADRPVLRRIVETVEAARRRRRRRPAGARRQGPRLAQHLLDVVAPGVLFTAGHALDRRIGAVAVPPRQEGGRPGRAAADPLRRRRPTSNCARWKRPRRRPPEGPGRPGQRRRLAAEPQVRPAVRASPASSSPATRPPASIPSLPTSSTSSTRPACPARWPTGATFAEGPQLPDDDRGGRAGGPQGPQVPADAGLRPASSFAWRSPACCSPARKRPHRLPRRIPGHGRGEALTAHGRRTQAARPARGGRRSARTGRSPGRPMPR